MRDRRERIKQRPERRIKRNYYWCHAVVDGKQYLIGAVETEREAQQLGLTKLPVDFRVIMLPTRNISEASRLLRGKMTQNNEFGQSLNRIRHKV